MFNPDIVPLGPAQLLEFFCEQLEPSPGLRIVLGGRDKDTDARDAAFSMLLRISYARIRC